MAVIQTLMDGATNIVIDKSFPTALTMSRGQHLKTQARAPSTYKFSVGLYPAYNYANSRGLLEDYDATGRNTEEEITLSNSTGGSWIMDYQGKFNNTDLNSITVSSVNNANIVLDVSGTSSAGPGTVLVEKGDYIQPASSRYSYQATAQVLRGSGSTVTVPINRAVFDEDGYTIAGKGIEVGVNCTFRVKMVNQPTYSIVPGRYVSWSGDMILTEVITS